MKNKHFKPIKYRIMAKRKDSDEPWTDWTSVYNYEEAVKHAKHIEEVGYLSKIVDNGEGCVVCGEVIPEGRQICPECEGGRNNDT